MREACQALLITAACFCQQAWAQRADDNATRSAGDAFGISIGHEKIGLYTDADTRGFSPLAAGNIRIEGMYFDSFLPARVVDNMTIRVGLTAQSYPFPAPTGIVDYTLRQVRDRNAFTSFVQAGPNHGYSIGLDAERQIVPGKLGIYASIYHNNADIVPSAQADGRAAGFVSRWRPYDGSEVTAFYVYGVAAHNKFSPLVFTAGPFLPPDIEAKFFGQDWTLNSTYLRNYGVLTRLPLGENWTLRTGLFRRGANNHGPIADLYLNTGESGLAGQHVVTNQRPQTQPSVSGEARLTGVFTGERLRQTAHLTVRGRQSQRNFGGAASATLAPLVVGQKVFLPEPDWTYRPSSLDEARQWVGGAQYQLAWRGLGEASLGVQKVDYEKTVTRPVGPPTVTADAPLFVNGSAALTLTKRLTFYAGFTQGLEEVALAPENAANANEAPPAIHTEQYDFGAHYALTPKLRLVLGYYNVEKPYFNLDPGRVYRNLGQERHRGVEFSLAGALTDRLNIVLGAALQKSEVTGEGVEDGLIGPAPVNQPETNLRLNLDYRTPWIAGLSVDAALTYVGERAAGTRQFAELGGGQLNAEAFSTLDIGARYRFKLAGHASTLRAQATNVLDDFAWRVNASGGFFLAAPRNFLLSLTTDF